eukprot:CAMPEP_0174893324 /NCGR_PEP_ID=MMETSP0167-20121228/8157_1 /TAXON_ID=38298 /ORGANISM="Rhodella maculata, Strain CCMP736" /LENGTH=84 /DNA_ID=CAMNT_0016132083 /DNA_START=81 /DNA_END=335 /DNA_ORIENTATION=-
MIPQLAARLIPRLSRSDRRSSPARSAPQSHTDVDAFLARAQINSAKYTHRTCGYSNPPAPVSAALTPPNSAYLQNAAGCFLLGG